MLESNINNITSLAYNLDFALKRIERHLELSSIQEKNNTKNVSKFTTNKEYKVVSKPEIKQEGLLGILKTSVVHPDFRKMGIGDAMVKHRVKWLQEQDVQTIKSYAWFVDDVVPAQKMLMNNGFEPLGDIKGWWTNDHSWDYPCSICGSKCKCVARIFQYKV